MTPPPIDVATLYREEVARARTMSLEDKLLEGPRLFERACILMAEGIRHRQPGLDQRDVDRLIRRRLARLAMLDR